MLSIGGYTGITTASGLPSPSALSTTSRCSSSSVVHSISSLHTASLKTPCNLEPLKSIEGNYTEKKENHVVTPSDSLEDDYNHNNNHNDKEVEEEEEEEEEELSGIQVPRQKYIPIPKSELLNGIVSKLFESRDEDLNHFLLLSSCLDSILHAEHKAILEEMRTDYFSTQSIGDDEVSSNGKPGKYIREPGKYIREPGSDEIEEQTGAVNEPDKLQLPFNYDLDLRRFLGSSTNRGLDLMDLFGSPPKYSKKQSDKKDRLAVATRFQLAFMQLLENAQFEELSARDLVLTSSLNTDYLLTLPIYVDWKKAYESNAIIFRRGYATERQKGLLVVEKLDYIQSKLLQGIFSTISKPFGKIGKWINEAFTNASETEEMQEWIKRMKLWLTELSLFQQSYLSDEEKVDNLTEEDQLSDANLPIWLAAQKAVSRYEGFLSPVGPRERLFRKLLARVGLIPPDPATPVVLDDDSNGFEPYLRPNFLSRMTLSDVWRPATRKYCGNDIWKRLKTSISILLSPSALQEPAFQELILLYTKDVEERNMKDESQAQSLQLKIYERIPIPDLSVVFPHKKLSFRIIDTVRLDVATILGLLAYFINYKFENIASSPSAILLDVIAVSALIIYATRVGLGYKQTWDRYQLLVNKTLYEKTLASGFGSVHFLLDASEQQQTRAKGIRTCEVRQGDICDVRASR